MLTKIVVIDGVLYKEYPNIEKAHFGTNHDPEEINHEDLFRLLFSFFK